MWIALGLAAVSLTYLSILSAKTYTWVFVSEDAANWLVCSAWWITPQPLGSPLYVLLLRFLDLFPGDPVIKITIILSCVPSAIAIALLYLTVNKLTGSRAIAVTSSAILLASAIFLSQSTVLEEYALVTMFLTLGLYFHYARNNRKLCWVGLGLATAVHIIILPVIVIWFIIDWSTRRENLRALPLYLLFGVAPYSLSLVLMGVDTPRFFAGALSIESVTNYLFGVSGKIFGALSIFELPGRVRDFILIMGMCLGLSWWCIYKGVREKFGISRKLLYSTIGFASYFYISFLFSPGWVFLIIAFPPLAILAGLGLSRLSKNHLRIVLASSIALVITNGFMLNANTLTNERPIASDLYQEIMSLPDGSAVIGTPRYVGTAITALSRGKDVIPIIAGYTDYEEKFTDYMNYLENHWELDSADEGTIGYAKSAMEQGRKAYMSGYNKAPFEREMVKCFILSGDGLVREITGFTGYPFPSLSWDTSTPEE